MYLMIIYINLQLEFSLKLFVFVGTQWTWGLPVLKAYDIMEY